jgi:outer membrane protein assembly factor BamD
MKKTGLFVVLLTLGCVVLPHRSPAPIVVREGEATHYVAPGSEDVPNEKDAQTQFDKALAKESAGDVKSAITGYLKTVRRFPKSSVAPTAQYKAGALYEKEGNISGASAQYEKLIKNYPRSTDFNTALEGEYRIATAFLEGARQKVLGVPTLPSMQSAIKIYSFIISNAPFSRFAPLSQFNIGQALEKEGDYKNAIISYQGVVDKYPTDPAAADALYQIGFVNMLISRTGSNDRNASVRAKESFDDFLAAYPTSEKAAQAKENLASLNMQQTGGSFQIARYYDRQKMYKAAIIYYNDVIRQQPSSPEGDQAKKRLDALRTKLGETVFNQATSTTPIQPANAANKAPAVNSGDGRLQAQTDTARRPDYVGPPVSAPAPPPLAPVPADTSGTAAAARPSSQGEPKPPPVPEGEQPALPSQ